MPKLLEEMLAKEASKKGLKGKNKSSYIWGTMNKIGVVKGNKITAKGKAMEKKEK